MLLVVGSWGIPVGCWNGPSQGEGGTTPKASTKYTLKPGYVVTTREGYYMEATIDGKRWVAREMMANDFSGSKRIQGENGGQSIGFYLWIPGLRTGSRYSFHSGNAADLLVNDSMEPWSGSRGEVEILKIDQHFIEGTFHFTGTSNATGKTIEVTGGYFRLPQDNL